MRIFWPELHLTAFVAKRRMALCIPASAVFLALFPGLARAAGLDIDDTDGLNTTTIAKREQDVDWQSPTRYGAQTVAGHNRKFVEPDPIRAGNYIFAPNIGTAVVFDDNVFATDADKRADIRTEVTPRVRLDSQFARHALDFSLDGKIVNYVENSDQDYANIRGRVSGALHFNAANTLSASVLSSLSHEERNSPIIPESAREPVQILRSKAAIGITHDAGRLYGTLSAAAETIDFSDAVSVTGNRLDLDPLDTKIYSAQLRAGYRISPGYELVTKIRGLRTTNRGNGTIDNDALGFEALAGLAFETDPLLKWRILGGFGVEDYETAGRRSLIASLYEGQVQWLPTQLLTIYGTLSRNIREAGGLDGSGLIQTELDVRADYEVYHNLLLHGGVTLREDDPIVSNTTERTYSGHLGLDYYLNKNWLFTFAYDHDVRESDSDSRDLNRNRFTFGARLRF